MQKLLCKAGKKVNKKGFTLVELLVSIAIMAVISLLVAEFIASTTGAYRRVSSTTKVQETCQDALNQVANIVRNSKSLTVKKHTDGRITFESVNYENKNILLVYVPDVKENDYGRIFVDYDYVIPTPAEGEEPVAPDITLVSEGEKYNEYLLCDMVKSFNVDFSKYIKTDDKGNTSTIIQERVLDLELTLERNEREYSNGIKASLRNSSPEGQTTELTIKIIEG